MYICHFMYAFADSAPPFALWTGFGHFPLFAPFCPGDEDTRKNRARPSNIGGRGCGRSQATQRELQRKPCGVYRVVRRLVLAFGVPRGLLSEDSVSLAEAKEKPLTAHWREGRGGVH